MKTIFQYHRELMDELGQKVRDEWEAACCGNCKFCNTTVNLVMGECRRYPPVMHEHDNLTYALPVTKDYWCGEWQPIPIYQPK